MIAVFFFLILEYSKRLDYNCRIETKGKSFNTNFDALDNHNRATLNPLIPLLLASKKNVAVNKNGLKFYGRSHTQSHHYPFESPYSHHNIVKCKGYNCYHVNLH